MKLNRGERRTLILVGAVLVLLLLYALAFKPLLERKSAGMDPAGQAQQVSQGRQLLAKTGNIRDRHRELSAALAVLQKAFLKETEPARGGIALLALVDKLAVQSDLTLESKEINRPQGTPLKIRVTVDGSGETAKVLRFVHAILSAEIRLNVERLDLTAGEGRLLRMRAVVATLLPGAKSGVSP